MDQIELADCYDWLPKVADNSVDLILTDPPFNISNPEAGFESVKNGVQRFAVSKDFGMHDKELDWTKLAQQFKRVLKVGGTAIIFYDIWKLARLKMELEKVSFKMFRHIQWVKKNPVPHNSKSIYLCNAIEHGLVCVKGSKPTYNAQYNNGLFYHGIPRAGKGKVRHPNMKPVKLLTELLQVHSRKGDLVLDCFAGSGTTLTACQQTGRHFIGCEIDPQYLTTTRD